MYVHTVCIIKPNNPFLLGIGYKTACAKFNHSGKRSIKYVETELLHLCQGSYIYTAASSKCISDGTAYWNMFANTVQLKEHHRFYQSDGKFFVLVSAFLARFSVIMLQV